MPNRRPASHIALWIVQGLLAALFLFAGGSKLAMPAAELARLSPLPASFLRFIGACEVLGALGLVLPDLFRVGQGLTPLAATGLAVIMTGAVVVSAITQGMMAAVIPLLVDVLAALVALGRRPPWLRRVSRTASGPRGHRVDFHPSRSTSK